MFEHEQGVALVFRVIDEASRAGGAGVEVVAVVPTRVAGTAGSEDLAQTGPGSVGAGQAVVDVDTIRLHAEREKRAALRGEVLRIGTAPAYPTSILATGRLWRSGYRHRALLRAGLLGLGMPLQGELFVDHIGDLPTCPQGVPLPARPHMLEEPDSCAEANQLSGED